MNEDILSFDTDRSILICRSSHDGTKRWLKRMENITFIASVIEDAERYYVMGESGETMGEYLVVSKNDGATRWFIPGRAFFHLLYNGFLFLIFIDEKNLYWFIKVELDGGKPMWQYRIDSDLEGYRFHKNRITLTYRSGARTVLCPESGRPIGS